MTSARRSMSSSESRGGYPARSISAKASRAESRDAITKLIVFSMQAASHGSEDFSNKKRGSSKLFSFSYFNLQCLTGKTAYEDASNRVFIAPPIS